MSDWFVGMKLWVFDGNHRVYDPNNRLGPIYSEHFRPTEITGETSRSWLVGPERYQKKVPKKQELGKHYGVYTDKQKLDDIWDKSNRYKIIDKVKLCSIEQLRQIAEILTPAKSEQPHD
jgi:hypothetical protein